MNLTVAQQTIIIKVCSIQFESLEDLLKTHNLGNMEDGQSYEEFFKEMGFDRLDFDRELISTIQTFHDVVLEPNRMFEYFDMIDVEIFEYIMFLFRKDIEPVYPKAYENLKYKLFIWKSANLHRS